MKNEPKIRIKGFEGEWETDKLGNLFSERVESDVHAEMLSVTLSQGIIKANENGRYDNSNNDKSKYRLVKVGDIAYNSMRMWQGASGYSPYYGIVSPAYTVVVPNNDVDSLLFSYLFKTANMIKQFRLNSQGLTTDTWNLKYPAFSKIEITYPIDLSEQRAIATYFRHLDSLIETADKKLSSLKQVKEASLQTMFPQEGQSVPKVRFKGFEGEWKIYKGDDLFETYNERNRPDLPVLSAFQDIRGMAVRSDSGYEISHDKRNEVTYKVVEPGQFVMHLRSFQGGFAHSAIEGITSPAYTVFGFKDPNANNDYYWKTIFMSKGFIDRLKTITYGIRDGRSISFPEFLQMKFRVPSIEEQLKLASFFVHLDKQIELAQQRLALLRRIKSACLDEMFV